MEWFTEAGEETSWRDEEACFWDEQLGILALSEEDMAGRCNTTKFREGRNARDEEGGWKKERAAGALVLASVCGIVVNFTELFGSERYGAVHAV